MSQDQVDPSSNDLADRPVIAETTRYWPASVTVDEARRAYDAWGANCGPGALAALLGKALEDVRPYLPGFALKHYTNPMMMLAALRELGVRWTDLGQGWPVNGLVRVQWGGPWMRVGVPVKARYRHTHWIATRLVDGEMTVFDINGACVGWMRMSEWSGQLVPWLLREVEPKGDGTWSVTHRLELQSPLPVDLSTWARMRGASR